MAVKPRVFVSYSSRDHVQADAMRAALEAAGVPCWIAPRDLSAGTQWGAGIVQAIDACEAVLVVFSQAANDSPQVAREMELAVSRRRPLIPVRVADAQPTDDMQYFLGVSHWFNAYPEPVETYLADIVAAVKRVLANERRPWALMHQRLPKTRGGQIAAMLGGAAAVALIVGLSMRPSFPTGPMASPLAGRWETRMPDGSGGQVACDLEIQKTSLATFSENCPDSLSGATGGFAFSNDGAYAPDLFRPGDKGSFQFLGGTANGYAAAFRRGLFGSLQTRDNRFGALTWRKVGGGKPLNADAPVIVPAAAAWPLGDTPAIAERATAYVRKKWQADAVLMSIDAKPGQTGGVDAAFTYYSPDQQQVRTFEPGSLAGALGAPGAAQDDVSQAIPARFLDLPQAIERARQLGMQGKQVQEARLEWTGGASCGTGDFRIDNAILPRCRPGRFVGVQWQIDSALGERLYVPAG
jgi:hypothetical protein